MSNERIVFTKPDGTVGVIIPTEDRESARKDVPADATNVRDVTTADLPANRLYRDAWDDSNPEPHVGVNMTKAKEIAHGRRREKREKVFAPHLPVVQKAASGIPLKPGEDAAASRAAMDDYKANVDDVAQVDIDNAADDVTLEAVERGHGIVE